SNLGDYQKALPLYERSLDITEKSLGPEHPDVALSLHYLASLYSDLGDYQKALPLFERSLEIREKMLGPEHPDVADSLNNLATLYSNLGDYQKALPLYERSLEIAEKSLSPEHPYVAGSLHNLANHYFNLGDYQKALPLFERSLEIYEKSLGPEHPDVALTLFNLSLLHISLQQPKKALEYVLRSIPIQNSHIKTIVGMVPEKTALDVISEKNETIHLLINLTYRYFLEDKYTIKHTFEQWFLRKGIILDAYRRFYDVIFSDETDEVKELLLRLKDISSRLTSLYHRKDDKEVEKTKKIIDSLEEEREAIRLELIQKSKAFKTLEAIWDANIDTILNLIPHGSCLIDFALIPQYDSENNKWLDPHYYVFILSRDHIELLDLGEAHIIDELIDNLRKTITPGERGPVVIEIPIHKIAQNTEDTFKHHAHNLYNKIFSPLKDKVKDNIIISPDGYLNLIPFEVLVDEDGSYLIDNKYTFTYIATPRELFLFSLKEDRQTHISLIMGNPDFDMDIEEAQPKAQVRAVDIFGRFDPLPATEEEVKAIHSIIGDAQLFTGKDAREDVLNKAESPRFLHLATHGFFKDDTPNPLVSSGIALAGANKSYINPEDYNGTGIVTAEKILNLRLKGTDMVVLSACETGLGGITKGEGIYGLRRAFTQVGARGIVTSLWKVPDKETKELMVAFYNNIITKNKKSPIALKEAILQVKNKVKETQNHTHPFFWGAFVYAGDVTF
ncbi:MAG: CHAT domain-containing protein, partial [Syntrophorhabdaceae bacterium]|nr:CHAT domain-containing protein [Syntrophorhabdaceae bacterium]